MKNIILCSDGTGNSGGICNSNVYRLFESLDLDATEVMEVTRVETEGKKRKRRGSKSRISPGRSRITTMVSARRRIS